MDLGNHEAPNEILDRIERALQAAVSVLSKFVPGSVKADFKSVNDPVTEADRMADRVLRELLQQDGEGWLSEETADDLSRLDRQRVWVVDPLDGTREFVAGIPEWCVSVGFVENGEAVAGGICNPATGEVFLGSRGRGVFYNGKAVHISPREDMAGMTVLASRSEWKRGEWERFRDVSFCARPMGSVAYKLALLSAGLADATWTLCPKNEWDIAAGVALVEAAGGFVVGLGNDHLSFNNRAVLIPGMVAGGPGLRKELCTFLENYWEDNKVDTRTR
jgi:myo-inositol-1(or 4)-monophosphatase